MTKQNEFNPDSIRQTKRKARGLKPFQTKPRLQKRMEGYRNAPPTPDQKQRGCGKFY